MPATVTDWVTQTVTPATVTETVATITDSITNTVNTVVQTNTVTVTAAGSNNNAPARRDGAAGPVTITPSNVPAYASSCANAAAYSSACRCASATPATITAPTPTVTSTKTLSVTATVQVTAHATVTIEATATQTETVTATVTPCSGLVLNNNPPAGADCALRGWRDANKAPVVGYGDGASVEACANSCKANPACKAFIYGDPARGWNNFCELEAAPNGRADSSDTPFWWYDMACFKPCS